MKNNKIMAHTYINGMVSSATFYQLMVEKQGTEGKMTHLVPLDKNITGFTTQNEAERARKYIKGKTHIDVVVIPFNRYLCESFEAFKAWRSANRSGDTPTLPVKRDLSKIDKVYLVTKRDSNQLEFLGEYYNEQEAVNAAGDTGEIKTLLVFDNANKFYRYLAQKNADKAVADTNAKS